MPDKPAYDWMEEEPAAAAAPAEPPLDHDGGEDERPGRRPTSEMDGHDRRRERTRMRKRMFLQLYRVNGIIAPAARGCDGEGGRGVSRDTVKYWRESDPDFARLMDEAWDDGMDMAEAELHRRAVIGWDEPVTFQGRLTYEPSDPSDPESPLRPVVVRKFSDTLLVQFMRAKRAKEYRDNATVQHEAKGGVLVVPGPVDQKSWEAAAEEAQAKHRRSTEA